MNRKTMDAVQQTHKPTDEIQYEVEKTFPPKNARKKSTPPWNKSE